MKNFFSTILILIFGGLLWIIMILHQELKGETSTVAIIEMERENDSIADEKEKRCININTADLQELTKLPGIGKVIGSRIIEYRKTKGKIYNLNDLDRVKGIGPAKLKKIRKYICF